MSNGLGCVSTDLDRRAPPSTPTPRPAAYRPATRIQSRKSFRSLNRNMVLHTKADRVIANTSGLTRMRLADLRPSDRNPRIISTSRFENLKRSLEQDRAFLDARPLLVNSYPGRESIVIAGNIRLRAAQ